MFVNSFFCLFFFFFKQKTAYEMLLCDWSSDVCSSDLDALRLGPLLAARLRLHAALGGRAARRLGERRPGKFPSGPRPRRPLPRLARPDLLPDRVLQAPPPVQLRPRAARRRRQLGVAAGRVPARRPRRPQVLRTRTMRTAIPTVIVLLALAPCRAADKLHVVATTADLAAIATAVADDAAEVTTLARPGEDPHFVDPKPSFIVTLNRADALIEGGAALEAGWLPPLLDSARNPRIASGAPGRIVASEGIALREVPSELDRSLGDIHPFGNPH